MTARIVMILLAAAALASVAHGAEEINVSGGLTGAGAPLAMHGYDPVAYFTDGVAMIGSAKHSVKRDGAAYRFVSEANKRRFEKNPARYQPQFGGFCAYGVSVGKKFDGDPRVWKIVDGKLYFNLNPDIKATWLQDTAGNLRKADKNWPRIQSKPASAL
ncbi:hypothetical protein ABI59_09270 [Acidobacteria bacterium Mor1]|nr:hypothetical protein ABI59_09270 [Acidobacteria bacterium Mor1]